MIGLTGITTRLSVDSAALAIFGTTSVPLIGVVEKLGRYAVADTPDPAGRNSIHGGTRGLVQLRVVTRTHDRADSPEKLERRDSDDNSAATTILDP